MGRGRPKGSKTKNRRVHPAYVKRAVQAVEASKAVEASMEAAEMEPFEGDSLMFLMAIYKNPSNQLAVRMDAAKSALPYERARLAPVESTQKQDQDISLKDRLAAYAREDTIEASEGKVVEMRRK